jgi:hypothetical protein
MPVSMAVKRTALAARAPAPLYCAPFAVAPKGVMEPNQIRSEITALRARFDALRGYL